MTPIIFPAKDYDLIKHLKKTMFIRTGDTRLTVTIGDWIPVVFKDITDTGLVEIVDVIFKRFVDLTVKDANDCGFDSLPELKSFLVQKYTTLDNNSRLYCYRFELMGTSEKIVNE